MASYSLLTPDSGLGTTSATITTTPIEWTCDVNPGTAATDNTNYGYVWRWEGPAITEPRAMAVTSFGCGERRPASEPTGEAVAAHIARSRQKRLDAEAKAAVLLKRFLSGDQRRLYERKRAFYVLAEDGKRYEIDCRAKMHNIFEVDDSGVRLREYCIFQSGLLPKSDNHLAQKLLLESNLKRFKEIANITELRSAG